jgi:hypothetical protein
VRTFRVEVEIQERPHFTQRVRGILDACRVPPGLTRKQALAFIRATKFRRPKELR